MQATRPPNRVRWTSTPTTPAPAAIRSLADIQPAEEARIESILFGMLRDLCYGLGLHEGDCVRCRRSSGAALVLEAAGDRTIVLDQDWARSVRIAACARQRTDR